MPGQSRARREEWRMTMNPPSQSPAASYDPALSLGEPVSGWLLFAGTVLGLAGLMRVFDAIWAFAYNGALPQHLQDSVLGSNLTTYAWLWLIVGALLIVSSFLLLSRSQLARWVGFVAVAVHAWPVGLLRGRLRAGPERHGVDAVLPRLVAHLRRHRGADLLRARRPRR